MGGDFGIGIRIEFMPFFLKFAFENFVIFDDSVMDQEYFFVAGPVGMAIFIARLAMSCPTAVTNAYFSVKIGINNFLEIRHSAFIFENPVLISI